MNGGVEQTWTTLSVNSAVSALPATNIGASKAMFSPMDVLLMLWVVVAIVTLSAEALEEDA